MSALPKYFFAEHPDLPGAGFMISALKPCYICKIYKFKKEDEFNRFLRSSRKQVKQMPGYMLAVQFFGIIGEEYQSVIDELDLDVAMKDMVSFYMENRVLANEGYYRKHKLE